MTIFYIKETSRNLCAFLPDLSMMNITIVLWNDVIYPLMLTGDRLNLTHSQFQASLSN
jgi:hypothetical protein